MSNAHDHAHAHSHALPGRRAGGPRTAIVTAAAVAGLAVYAGFPRRVGATSTDAAQSLPGDLLLPTARFQADRKVVLPGLPSALSASAPRIRELYEQLWRTELELAFAGSGAALAQSAQSAPLGQTPGALAAWTGQLGQIPVSLAVTFTPAPDGQTAVHVRERYDAPRGLGAAARIQARLLSTALAVPALWNRVRRFAQRR